jgi:hypothetical protein
MINEYLHEALVSIGLIWCSLALLFCLAVGIYVNFRGHLKRFIGWVAEILSRCIEVAQERRRQRREAQALFYVESIEGTRGYRIKTR